MMLKKKSNPWARLKYLYVLPLAALTLSAFARPEVSNELKEISAFKVNDLVENQLIPASKNSSFGVTMPIEGTEMQLLQGEMERVSEGRWRNTNAVTMVYQSNKEERNHDEGDSELSNYTPQLRYSYRKVEEQRTDSVRPNYRMEVTTIRKNHEQGVDTVSVSSQLPLVIIDGKVASMAVLNSLNPNRIKTVSVLKEKEEAAAMYGEEGENGVIVITLIPENGIEDDNPLDVLGLRVIGYQNE